MLRKGRSIQDHNQTSNRRNYAVNKEKHRFVENIPQIRKKDAWKTKRQINTIKVQKIENIVKHKTNNPSILTAQKKDCKNQSELNQFCQNTFGL